MVGCCMIEIDSARPWPMPHRTGITIRAAAHRISVEVGSVDRATRAVYVPVRLTDARMAVLVGGRVFPGVHASASIVVDADDSRLSWKVNPRSEVAAGFDISASVMLDQSGDAASEVAEIVVGTVLGVSPGRRPGSMEAVEMQLDHQVVRTVELSDLDSKFLTGFSTAEPAETLLMTDVGVIWRPVPFRAKSQRQREASGGS